MRLSLSIVFFAAALASAGHAAERCPPSEALAEKVIASTVTVLADQAGGALGSGSGFFIGKDLVATNWHVVESATRLRIKKPAAEETFDVAGVVAADLANDLAVLQVKTTSAAPLPLALEVPKRGARVYAFGSPYLLEATMSDGIVSAERDIEGAPRLQITAAISPGSSGGPVTDECGRVVGVAYMKVRQAESLNFAIPARFLDALTKKMGPPRTPDALAREGAAGLQKITAQRLGVPDGVDPERWVQTDKTTEKFFVGLQRRELGGAELFRHIGRDDLVKKVDNTGALALGITGGICAALGACGCLAAIPLLPLAGLGIPVGIAGGGSLCLGAGLGGAGYALWQEDMAPPLSFAERSKLVEAYNAKLLTAARKKTAPPPPLDGAAPPPPPAADAPPPKQTTPTPPLARPAPAGPGAAAPRPMDF